MLPAVVTRKSDCLSHVHPSRRETTLQPAITLPSNMKQWGQLLISFCSLKNWSLRSRQEISGTGFISKYGYAVRYEWTFTQPFIYLSYLFIYLFALTCERKFEIQFSPHQLLLNWAQPGFYGVSSFVFRFKSVKSLQHIQWGLSLLLLPASCALRLAYRKHWPSIVYHNNGGVASSHGFISAGPRCSKCMFTFGIFRNKFNVFCDLNGVE